MKPGTETTRHEFELLINMIDFSSVLNEIELIGKRVVSIKREQGDDPDLVRILVK